ncbi:MAG TPA: Rieske (2Fe-2S) protein [Anaerolineae bacterium]
MVENVFAGRRQRGSRRYVVCRADDLAPGERKIVDVDGKSVGVFNVGGRFYALLNYCPHNGGALCRGPVTGTTLPTDKYEYVYGREGAILRCAWHGWEFDIATGESLIDPHIRARTYPVSVENGEVVVRI